MELVLILRRGFSSVQAINPLSMLLFDELHLGVVGKVVPFVRIFFVIIKLFCAVSVPNVSPPF